jgi:LDH2 family malate/lactate/ureidoglycolate dehydrogenase
MIGIYTAVANANHMPAWGSSESLLGTNPIAFAIPTDEEPPIILDMATTVVSYGTVKKHAIRGEPMPEGWMISPDGRPITDASRAGEGFLLPIGAYKGSGLAIALGLLAGTLNGAAFGREVVDFNADDVTATNTGHAIMVLDVARFLPPAELKREVDRQIRELRASERLPGVEAIYMPGEQRARRIAERTARGIPLPDGLVTQLNRVAEAEGVAPLDAPSEVTRHA